MTVNHGSEYRSAVVSIMAADLVGDLDRDRPRVVVELVVDVTHEHPDYVLWLELHLLRPDRSERWVEGHGWDCWMEYEDQSPESMAAGLAVLVRTDIREEFDTGKR